VERRAVREQRTLAPRWRERRRRRTILLALVFVISTTMLIVVRANRTYAGDGRYRVGPALLMAALVASVGLIIVVWTVVADVLGAITTTPLSHRVWTSPIGRAFYRIATLGMAEPPSTGASVSPVRR
jgi:putative copper export protein